LALKVLFIDPDNEEAQAVLSAARAVSQPFFETAAALGHHRSDEAFAVEYQRPETKKEQKPRRLPIVLVSLAVVLVLLMITRNSQLPTQQNRPRLSAITADPNVRRDAVVQPAPIFPSAPKEETRKPQIATANPTPKGKPPVPVSVPPKIVVSPSPKNVESPSPKVAVSPQPKPVPSVASGKLAVNSPIATEIYFNNLYLGSTPITLELPAGNHTLDYRHGDLRRIATHVVKATETTTAMVTFDTTLQINAKPWARVFLEGASRRLLGQTPLSDVRVPIGSTLLFENPNFPAKSHRVTETDTAIRVVFP
jgi:hypothetical protein